MSCEPGVRSADDQRVERLVDRRRLSEIDASRDALAADRRTTA